MLLVFPSPPGVLAAAGSGAGSGGSSGGRSSTALIAGRVAGRGSGVGPRCFRAVQLRCAASAAAGSVVCWGGGCVPCLWARPRTIAAGCATRIDAIVLALPSRCVHGARAC